MHCDPSPRPADAPTGLPCRWASPSRPRVRWRQLAVLLTLGVGSALAPASRAQETGEASLKAVFLYNLASFVEWPAEAFATAESPFVIAVLGRDPFGGVLDEIVANEYVGKHPFEVRRLGREDDLAGAHVLFISGSESRRVEEVLREVGGHPVLTVADFPGFAEAGGMINLAVRDDQLQIFINPRAVRACNLTVSSKLLELARIVEEPAASP